MRTNVAGVAVCSCGAELVVACSGGCAEPGFEIREDVARAPRDRHRHGGRVKAADVPPGTCSYQQGCDQPVVPGEHKGRPYKKCAKHLAMSQQWEENRKQKRAGAL